MSEVDHQERHIAAARALVDKADQADFVRAGFASEQADPIQCGNLSHQLHQMLRGARRVQSVQVQESQECLTLPAMHVDMGTEKW